MKQFNQWLAALFVLCASLGSYAQSTCNTATTLTPNVFGENVSLPTNADTVWYTFTPTGNGYITISSCDKTNDQDTRLFLFEGSCSSLNTVGTSDNDCGLSAMLNDKRVEAGKTYFLRWDNKTGALLNFDFDMTFVADADYINPVNDDICDATALALGVTALGNNEDASSQGFAEYNLPISIVPNSTQVGWQVDRNIHNSVWYKFVATTTGSVAIEVTSGAFDVQAALFSGSCTNIGGLTLMGAADDVIGTDVLFYKYCVTAGQTYFILVDGFGVQSGDFNITVSELDITRPHVAMITVSTDDPRCPGEEIYDLMAELVTADDSSSLLNADYVNSLRYSWRNSSNAIVGTSSVLADRKAGAYTLTITDTCGKTYTSSVTLTDTVINPLDLVLVSTTNPTCIGAVNGTVTLTHSGGYRFDNGSFVNTDSLVFTIKRHNDTDATSTEIFGSPSVGVASFTAFNNLFQGTYRIYVEDACGNVDSVTFVITDPGFAQIQLDSLPSASPFCPGTSTGFINLLAAGGEGLALTYTWYISNNGGLTYSLLPNTTQDLTNIPQGLYKVVVQDPCGNQDPDSITFNLVDPVVSNLSYTASKVNPTTFAAKNGSISIVVSGGKPVYSAMWDVDGISRPAFNDMLNLTNLPQGIYHVTITDTCASAGIIDTTFVLLAPVPNDSACKAITITANDSLTTYHNTNATATGEGTLTIPLNQDEGYDGWAEVNINQSVWFKFVAPSSGAVSLTASHYQGLVSNLNFDTQVALFAADSCNNYAAFDLLAANDNNFNGGPVNDSYLEVYCLNPGQTYYVMVDGYQGVGQQGIFNLDLDVIPVSPILYSADVIQPNCIEEQGNVSVTNIQGGVYRDAPESYLYTYTFNGSSGTIEVNPFGDITAVNGTITNILEFDNLNPGNYTLSIKDTCGNTLTKSIVIAPITATPLNLDYTLVSPLCPGDNSGSINFTISGGGTPGSYTYEIRFGSSNGSLVASGSYDDIFAPYTEGLVGEGLYFFKVMDGCGNSNVKEFVFQLNDPIYSAFSASARYDKPSCPGVDDATITVVMTGGSFMGNYALFVGPTIGTSVFVTSGSIDSVATISNLSDGNYFLVVEDACEGDTVINIKVIDPIPTPIVTNVVENNPTTNGGNNGSFIYNISGGFPEYSVFVYEITGINGVPIDTLVADFAADDNKNYTVSNLDAGFYRIAINDACGDVLSPDEVVDFELVNPPLNNNACDAALLAVNGVNVTGTTVAATVQQGELLITPELDEECGSFVGWCLNNGIDASVWYKVVVPASGAFSVEAASGAFDPQIALYTVENCANFSTYTLLAANDDKAVSPANQNGYVETGCLIPGTTVFILVDAADFPAEGEFTIKATELNEGPLTILSNVINATTETSNDGIINIQVVGGVKPYTYSWTDDGEVSSVTTDDRTNLGPGTYTLTVRDKCGTSTSRTFILGFTEASNDDVCNAKLLPVDNINYIFSNIGSSVEDGEFAIAPDSNSTNCFGTMNWCKSDGLDGTVWFKFIAPSTSVRVDLCNNAENEIDPQLAVYAAELCSEFGTFTLLGANDDSQTCSFGSVLTLTNLVECQTYYIMIDSDEGSKGDFGIKLTDLNSSLNAGRDTTVAVCQNSGNVNVKNYVSSNAQQDGFFVDTDDTEALGGSIVNTNELTPGMYRFTYVVADSCSGQISGADYAVITLNVRNCTSIDEVSAGTFFSVYPNPNNGIFTLTNNGGASDVTVEVFDMTGKMVYNVQHPMSVSENVTINMNATAKGVYTIRVSNNANSAEFHRVVVQ